MVKRISCVAENCGTFPMDDALYKKLQRTGETFHCPEGHAQHFTETVEDRLRKRIQKLEQKAKRVDELRRKLEREKKRADHESKQSDSLLERWREQREHRKHLEALVLEHVEGIIEIAPDEYKWSCGCGGRGQKAFDTEEEARDAYEEHRRRNDCENGINGQVVEA